MKSVDKTRTTFINVRVDVITVLAAAADDLMQLTRAITHHLMTSPPYSRRTMTRSKLTKIISRYHPRNSYKIQLL